MGLVRLGTPFVCFTVWTIAIGITNVVRLMTDRTGLLFLLTAGSACAAAFLASVMAMYERAEGFQVLVALVILTVLGFLLTPIANRLR